MLGSGSGGDHASSSASEALRPCAERPGEQVERPPPVRAAPTRRRARGPAPARAAFARRAAPERGGAERPGDDHAEAASRRGREQDGAQRSRADPVRRRRHWSGAGTTATVGDLRRGRARHDHEPRRRRRSARAAPSPGRTRDRGTAARRRSRLRADDERLEVGRRLGYGRRDGLPEVARVRARARRRPPPRARAHRRRPAVAAARPSAGTLVDLDGSAVPSTSGSKSSAERAAATRAAPRSRRAGAPPRAVSRTGRAAVARANGTTTPWTAGKLCSQAGSWIMTGTTSQRGRADVASRPARGSARKSERTKTKLPWGSRRRRFAR